MCNEVKNTDTLLRHGNEVEGTEREKFALYTTVPVTITQQFKLEE
jgi:hypothetical protein